MASFMHKAKKIPSTVKTAPAAKLILNRRFVDRTRTARYPITSEKSIHLIMENGRGVTQPALCVFRYFSPLKILQSSSQSAAAVRPMAVFASKNDTVHGWVPAEGVLAPSFLDKESWTL